MDSNKELFEQYVNSFYDLDWVHEEDDDIYLLDYNYDDDQEEHTVMYISNDKDYTCTVIKSFFHTIKDLLNYNNSETSRFLKSWIIDEIGLSVRNIDIYDPEY